MFRVTVALFILSCCLTGYRLVGQALPALDTTQPVLAQSTRAGLLAKPSPQRSATIIAAPTVAPLFRAQTTVTVAPAPAELSTTSVVTAQATQQLVISTTTAISREQLLTYPEIVIYDDELNPSWTIEHSVETQTNLWDTSHWFQQFDPRQAHNSGATAIAVSPQADFGTILFSVLPDSNTVYQRQEVLGVSFWLNSGSNGIATADLAVTVLGSNALPYWTPDDHSVFPDDVGAFSETRLYFLDINRTIPADTWVNVMLWLNERQFDPIYQYVTGFYIKNDAEFRSTYYLDQVTLIMAP